MTELSNAQNNPAALATTHEEDLLDQAVATYLAGLAPNTQRAYASRLDAFMEWRAGQPAAPFVAHLKQYVAFLQTERGLSPRSVQAHINTIKGMMRTAAALEPRLAAGLPQLELVKSPRVRGQVQGRRLTADQAHHLLDAPGTKTIKGLRDSAILGLLLALGLRRSEVCNLTWGHLMELEGHRVIANLQGKHGRIRTLKVPLWLWDLLIDWGEAAGLPMDRPTERIFVPITKDGKVLDYREGITPHAIYKLVNHYTRMTGLPPVKPHDLRRTAALLSRRGGASIEKVQIMLGHASPQTTSSYIGEVLDLDDNAVDYNPLEL
jgi:integrase